MGTAAPGADGDDREVRVQGAAGDVARVVDAVLAAPPRLGPVRLLALDGRSGAGKSTLADAVVAELARRAAPTVLVRTDDLATWDDPVAWWSRLEAGVLAPLAAGRPGRYRRTVWAGGVPGPGPLLDVAVPAVLVLEGVSSARRAVAGRLSLGVWVSGGPRGERLARAVARDGEASRAELVRWQRFEDGWFAVDGTRARLVPAGPG